MSRSSDVSSTRHDTILYYGRGQRVTWNPPRTEYDQAYLDRYYKFDDDDGRLYWRNSLSELVARLERIEKSTDRLYAALAIFGTALGQEASDLAVQRSEAEHRRAQAASGETSW